MGCESLVYGMIEGALGGADPNHRRQLQRMNRAVICQLPRKDEWPWFTRYMFKVPREERWAGTYRNQVIHFGASFKEVEQGGGVGIEKFGALLGRFFWFSAGVHLNRGGGGRFDSGGEIDPGGVGVFRKDPPRPPTHWRF